MIFSSEFDAIQEARRFDDPSISQGEWVTEIKEADWPGLVRIGENILANQSKDLRVACWMIEAHCKIRGLAGLADGYTLLAQLCETFWNDIHPQPDNGDIEQRVGVLDWLAKQTPRLLREVPLTRSGKGNFSLIDLESARATAKQIERNRGQADEIARHAHVSLERFEDAAKDTAKTYFADSLHDAERARNAIKAVQASLDTRMGELSPAFGATFDTLEDVSHFFQRHAGPAANRAQQPADEQSSTSPALSIGSATERIEPTFGEAIDVAGGPIRSRQQAIHQLQEIASFFRRTEPHSPVAYLAEKAAKWGTMPLHEWLRTVVKDDSALLRMEELLGVETDRA
ncbi:type VI secretion system protein TssA [Dechloromonas sp. XY25]|uniref:Type VI secretion system protein TssA n=1 Tax=Dechloromonas hankyongensis TaxID=2908002 RepID=A0ABS9K3D2_9RHOO|nr:type VI secretion system protein TssA [Dechloromonas hankyongensis]